MRNVYASVHLNIDRDLPPVSDLGDVLRAANLHMEAQEVMLVVTYDSLMQMRSVIEVARGGYHAMEIPIPAIYAAVFAAGTDRFLIAHNHSTGDVTPTSIDVDLTKKVMAGANACGLFFEDHLILGPRGEQFSMTDAGIIIPSKELRTLAKNNKRVKL